MSKPSGILFEQTSLVCLNQLQFDVLNRIIINEIRRFMTAKNTLTRMGRLYFMKGRVVWKIKDTHESDWWLVVEISYATVHIV